MSIFTDGFLNVSQIDGIPVRIDPIPKDTNEYKKTKVTHKKYWCIHNAGNPKADDIANNNFMKRDDYVLWHFTVDEDSITQGHSIHRSGFHAGDGTFGEGNLYSIGIEIADNGDVAKATENAFALMNFVETKGNMALEIRPHQSFSGKYCPRWILDNWGWDGFMERYDFFKKSKNTVTPQTHWAEKEYQELLNKGIEIHERRFDDKITRGEVFALLNRILK